MEILTIGVEEEFHLIDPDSGRAVAVADTVLARAAEDGFGSERVRFHPELLASQIESVTTICPDLACVSDAISEGRQRLDAAARFCGVRLVSAGTPVFSGPSTAVTEGERFDAIRERYAGALTGYQSSGCHVHVGVPDRDTAVEVVNHLRPWLPTLLALSANSPFHEGRDTGFASWRMMLQARFPGSGVPPWFDSAADLWAAVERRVRCGVSVDSGMTAWLARPSPRFPTVEVRAADAATTLSETLLQATLTRALVATALTDLRAGRPPIRVRDDVASAAVWCAARYGLTGDAVHPRLERRVPPEALVAELLDHVGPELAKRGESDGVRDVIGSLLADGGGAGRQRAAAPDGLSAVVRMLSARTVGAATPTTAQEVP